MTTVKAVELEKGQWVYMQVDETVIFPNIPAETHRDNDYEDKGLTEYAQKAMDSIGDLIHAMSETTVKALQKSAFGEIEKVTLEFGITLGGEAHIPFITSGNAEGSVNITVEFAPKKTDE